jgi:hypothetical protein
MKKLFFSLITILAINIAIAQPPQDGQPPKRPSIEQRIKRINDTLSKKIPSITATQLKKIDEAFISFFTNVDKVTGDAPPPRPNATDEKSKKQMEQIKKYQKERDDKIQKILNAEQFKKFKEIEKSLRPKPPGNMPPPPQE